jgi:hypothetical protein
MANQYWCVWVQVLLLVPAIAVAQQAQPIPADLRPEVERAERIGQVLYQEDKASAIGTDVLLALKTSLPYDSIGGYLTFQEADEEGEPLPAFEVLFFARGEEPRILLEVHIPDADGAKPSVKRFDPPAVPSESQLRLIRARQAALAAVKRPAQPLNPAILPGHLLGKDGVLVYLLAATTQPKTAVFGMHYRALVSPDGSTVTRFEPLSKSILELSTEMPPDQKTAALAVTHLMTDAPLETHVFTSLLMEIPVVVITARGDWLVNGAHITFLQARSGKSPAKH